MDVHQVRALLATKAGDSGSAFAKLHGLSASYVNEAIKGTREPGEKILNALNLERVVTYQKKGKTE